MHYEEYRQEKEYAREDGDEVLGEKIEVSDSPALGVGWERGERS